MANSPYIYIFIRHQAVANIYKKEDNMKKMKKRKKEKEEKKGKWKRKKINKNKKKRKKIYPVTTN